MTKEEILLQFNPNDAGRAGKLFGLPYDAAHSDIVIIPVPWEVTVSYREGTANGPQAVLKASSQLEFFSREIKNVWHLAVDMMPISMEQFEESRRLRQIAAQHIAIVESGEQPELLGIIPSKINEACENLNIYVKNISNRLIKEGKLVGVLGGDHSTPLGLIRALTEKHERFGILQIDAHADLRRSYEGFTYSHASIMFNALKLPGISRLVQVGIRDFCEEEMQVMQRSMGRIKPFFDRDIKSKLFDGVQWSTIVADIVKELPQEVYISFDIDGLDPKLCPCTGTPVPGGFEFDHVSLLLQHLVKSGRKIIGFDLCEVAAGENEWDANVGARILRELCNWAAVSQGLLKMES